MFRLGEQPRLILCVSLVVVIVVVVVDGVDVGGGVEGNESSDGG